MEVLERAVFFPLSASPASSGHTSLPEECPAQAPVLGTLDLWFGLEPRLSVSSLAVLILPLSLGLRVIPEGKLGTHSRDQFEVAIPEHMGLFPYTKIER